MRYLFTLFVTAGFVTAASACTEEQKSALSRWGCTERQVEKKCSGASSGTRKLVIPSASLRPLRPVQGVLTVYSRKALLAPFRVETPAGENYYVKLVEASDKKTPVLTLFIFGGGAFQTHVPLGSFILKYASGKDWYGQEHLFGPCKTSFFEAEADLSFTRSGNTVSGNRIVLIKQVGGNLSTTGVEEDEF